MRPRWIAVGVAVAMVLILVLLGQHGGTDTQQPAAPPGAPAASTASAASVGAGEPADEDEGDDGAGEASASPAAIKAGPAAPKEAAIQFLTKYLNTQGKSAQQWRSGFQPLVTPALADALAETEPTAVPVGRVDDGKVTTELVGDALQVATVPIVAGNPEQLVATVTVTLTGVTGRWLVSDLDVTAAGAPS